LVTFNQSKAVGLMILTKTVLVMLHRELICFLYSGIRHNR